MRQAIRLLVLAVWVAGCATTDGRTTSVAPAVVVASAPAAPAPAIPPRDDWRVYGGDHANTKYSPLAQIHRDNFAGLEIAWRWRSADQEVLAANSDVRTGTFETTPLMVDGVLYASTSLSQVAAIDARTGATLWVHDPKTWQGRTPPNLGFVHRGVAYWAAGRDRRILIGTGDGYLIALDAGTGVPVPSFGREGRIDLVAGLRRPGPSRHVYGVTSPPIVCRDVIVVGASILDFPFAEMPPGDIRGFDARTGAPRWVFHAVPEAGEFGVETWEHGSWQRNGNTNVWSIMSCDETLGYLYLPFSTPSNDYYGGDRHGDNLFAESLVALDATTGRRVWHQQLVHHGLWDYDLPAAPNLVDVTVGGRRRAAVAQVTKHGFCFVFDRVTGEPIWPIEERPVAQSTVPGERSSPTQPFPTRPAPFERQGMSEDDVLDFTPELRQEALSILRRHHHGPLFTPPSDGKPTIVMPGVGGGASWTGAAFDPDSGRLYVPSFTLPLSVTLGRPPAGPAPLVGRHAVVFGPRRLMLTKPPYGRITSIDLTTGEHAFAVPVGEGPRRHPALAALDLPRLGWPFRTHVLLTKTLLIAGQEGYRRNERMSARGFSSEFELVTLDPALQAFDKATGALIATVPLPANATGAPMTYMVAGRQYIVVAVGGSDVPAELVAFRLP